MGVKPPFSNFGSDNARVSVFGANEFYCCITEYRKAIYFPMTLSPAKMAVKPPFPDFGSDHTRIFSFLEQMSSVVV